MASKRSILRKVRMGIVDKPSWFAKVFPKEEGAAANVEVKDPAPTEDGIAEARLQEEYAKALKKVEEKKIEEKKVVTTETEKTAAPQVKKAETPKLTAAPKVEPKVDKKALKPKQQKKNTKVKKKDLLKEIKED